MPENNDASNIGQSAQYKDATEKYDAEHGKYKDNVDPGTAPINSQPAAKDPSPFKIGAL